MVFAHDGGERWRCDKPVWRAVLAAQSRKLHMKFSTQVASLTNALAAISRLHPSRAKRDLRMHIKATADGVTFDTNLSSAFVPAHVAVAGACIVARDAFTRVIRTFPKDAPLTIEAANGNLHIGSFRMPLVVHIASRENDAYRR